MICSVFLWKRHFKSPQDRIKTKVRSICVRKKFKSPETVGLTVIRNEITYQLLADGFRVHTKLPSDS